MWRGAACPCTAWRLPSSATKTTPGCFFNKKQRLCFDETTLKVPLSLLPSIFFTMRVSSLHDVACHIVLGGPELRRKSSGLSRVAAQQFGHCSPSQTPTPPLQKKKKKKIPSGSHFLELTVRHGSREEQKGVCVKVCVCFSQIWIHQNIEDEHTTVQFVCSMKTHYPYPYSRYVEL